jgi:hypothetical protein
MKEYVFAAGAGFLVCHHLQYEDYPDAEHHKRNLMKPDDIFSFFMHFFKKFFFIFKKNWI